MFQPKSDNSHLGHREKRLIFGGLSIALLLMILVGVTAVSNINRERETAYANAFKELDVSLLQDEVRVRSLLASIDSMTLMLESSHVLGNRSVNDLNLKKHLDELKFLHQGKIRITISVTGRESPSCGEVCSSLRRLAIHS